MKKIEIAFVIAFGIIGGQRVKKMFRKHS